MKAIHVKSAVLVLIGLALLISAGCGGDDGPTKPKVENNKLILDFYYTPRLPAQWLYQIWAFSDGQWVAGEVFNLDASGDLLDGLGQAIAGNTVTFSALDLTTCDSLRVMFGRYSAGTGFTGSLVFLTTAIGTSLSPKLESPLKDSVGAKDLYFIFGTPSDESEETELSGIWFSTVDHTSPSLDSLPDLSEDWVFEGWGYHAGMYLSTGKFTGNTGADQHCRYYNCSAATPDFPGEDFLVNPPAGIEFPFQFDEGDTILVSLEPADDPIPDEPFIKWHYRHLNSTSAELLQQLQQTHYIRESESVYWPFVNAFITSD